MLPTKQVTKIEKYEWIFGKKGGDPHSEDYCKMTLIKTNGMSRLLLSTWSNLGYVQSNIVMPEIWLRKFIDAAKELETLLKKE